MTMYTLSTTTPKPGQPPSRRSFPSKSAAPAPSQKRVKTTDGRTDRNPQKPFLPARPKFSTPPAAGSSTDQPETAPPARVRTITSLRHTIARTTTTTSTTSPLSPLRPPSSLSSPPPHSPSPSSPLASSSLSAGTSSPTASSKVSNRPPLQSRDKNAGLLSTRTSCTDKSNKSSNLTPASPPAPGSKSTPAKMAPNSRQPQMPTLSAAAARGANNGKTPLTPKIATNPPRAPTPRNQHRTVTVTPVPRRSNRPDSSLSNNGPGNNGPGRDDLPTQGGSSSSLLSANIVSRSGARQTHPDSSNSTPTGAPKPEKKDSWETRSGLGITSCPASDVNASRRPAVSFTAPPTAAAAAKQDPDSKFFYASQAQRSSPQPSNQPRAPLPQSQPPSQRGSTFFYANSANPPERQSSPQPIASPSATGSASVPQESRASKFIYANGSPNPPPTAATRSAFSPAPTPTLTPPTSSRIAASRLSSGPANTTPTNQNATRRPLSPVKLPSHHAQGKISNTNLSSNDSSSAFSTPCSPRSPRSTLGAAPAIAPHATHVHRRSIDSSNGPSSGSHARTKSLTVAEAPAVTRVIAAKNSHPPSEASSPRSPPLNPTQNTSAAFGFSSLLQAADDFDEDDESAATTCDTPQSPTKSSSQEQQQQGSTDLVANARRERKVQDLEITNASLEAINRTLERQLRKQTAELRRYRRLSRSGRLSLASVGSRERIASDSTAGGGALARAGLELDDLSEEESEEDDDLEGEDDEPMFGGSRTGDETSETGSELGAGDISPRAATLSAVKHRQRDEERLQLDLSKHQQLLVDSQKMNQSLKRCLGWTEELIREGRRALEYRVRVSEVKLGGRVLNPEDMEDRDEAANAPAHFADDDGDIDGQTSDGGDDDGDETLHGPGPLSNSPTGGAAVGPGFQQWSKALQDRDSGIELPDGK